MYVLRFAPRFGSHADADRPLRSGRQLFVVVEGSSFNPTAPDGNPPLAILLDTAAFIGNASVPLGLLVLGSALARMRLPRPLTKLPFASILSLALFKLVLLPVIGFLMVEGLTKHTNLVDEENRVLRFGGCSALAEEMATPS